MVVAMVRSSRRKALREAQRTIAVSQAVRAGAAAQDPVDWAEVALELKLDTWQRDIMRSRHQRLVVVAARQSGKSVITGAKAAYEAQSRAGLRVVVTAPSFRQAGLLADKIEAALVGSGRGVDRVRDRLTLDNGSVVTVLHGDRAATLRGHTADLLLCDEIGFIKPELMPAILPMVAASQGRLMAISSPNGPSGPLYDLAHQDGVELMRVSASDVAHFDPAVIAELRGRLGPALARQELDAEFVASSSSVFSADVLDTMFAPIDDPMAGADEVASDDADAMGERANAERLVEYREQLGHGIDDPRQRALRDRFNL